MLDLIYKVLSEDIGVSTTTSGRIFPYIREEQTDSPAVMFELQSSNFLNTMSTDSKADTHTVEVTCVAKTALQASTLGNQVRTALDNLSGDYTTTEATYNVASSRLSNYGMSSEMNGRLFVVTSDFTFALIR